MSDKKRMIFEETLTQAYSYERYRRFLGELLNHVQFNPIIRFLPPSRIMCISETMKMESIKK